MITTTLHSLKVIDSDPKPLWSVWHYVSISLALVVVIIIIMFFIVTIKMHVNVPGCQNCMGDNNNYSISENCPAYVLIYLFNLQIIESKIAHCYPHWYKKIRR